MLLPYQTWTISRYALVVVSVLGKKDATIVRAKVQITFVPARVMKGMLALA